MHIGLIQKRQDGVRVVLTLMIVTVVAAGTIALLEFRPATFESGQAAKAIETTTLEERDRLKIARLRQGGKNIPWHWRRKLVLRTAPSLAQWIDGMGERLGAAGAGQVPAALHDRLALSFKLHELMRARFIIDPDTVAAARDAGYHFGRRFAITFGDVIVFRDANAARDEIEWARQLVHLRQYHHWGLERFAIKYLENWRRIDREALRISARHAQTLIAIFGSEAAVSVGMSKTPFEYRGPSPEAWP